MFLQVFLLFAVFLSSCTTTPKRENATAVLQKPYVILISIDGFRHDYAEKFQTPTLNRMAKEGVRAQSLQPVYPSKTFPSHYSMATGLYADHHGIVSNEFYDSKRNQIYKLSDRTTVDDGTWYGGTPLWNEIENHGLLTASFFWVGSDAPIQGRHPTYFFKYDESIPNEKRIQQILNWLKLPEKHRPHFITAYFSDVDTQGHKFGTDAEETRQAALSVDTSLEQLFQGLKTLSLPINIIIVSDHGMTNVDSKKAILLGDLVDDKTFLILGRGPQMHLYLKRDQPVHALESTYQKLKSRAKNFRVYKRDEIPRSFHYSKSHRIGDLMIDAEAPYSVSLNADSGKIKGGNHGYDPVKYLDMHGIFYAQGPAFKKARKIPTFKNVSVFPLVLKILDLPIPTQIDGRLADVQEALEP